MRTPNADAIRLSPRCAEGFVAALDVLIIALGLLGVRVAASVGSGAAAADRLGLPLWDIAGIGLAALLIVILHKLGHYDRRRPASQEVVDLIGCGLLLGGLDAGFALLAGIDLRLPLLGWLAVVVLVPLVRARARRRLDLLGLWRRPTVIVGTGENARRAARALLREPSLGLPVVAFADLSGAGELSAASGAQGHGTIRIDDASISVVPAARLLADEAQADHATHVVLVPEAREMPACVALLERLAEQGCDFDFVPPLGGLSVGDVSLARLVGSDLATIRLRDPLSTPFSRLYKRGFDLVLGSALLIFTAPLIGVIALAIIVMEGWPAFFWHRRIGMNGRPFACVKFRTMVRDADARLQALVERDPAARAEWERARKLRNDPRISRLGAWLRRTSLDELPQLWNVVRGDMSLVGPRPVVEAELARYGARAAFYLKTRPGLSGLWQVSGRNDVDYAERVHLDCHYVRHWTPLWDLALLIATVRVVLSRRGAY